MNDKQSESKTGQAGGCSCPFCDAPAKDLYPFCKNCGKVVNHCKVCGKPVPPHRDICEDCKD